MARITMRLATSGITGCPASGRPLCHGWGGWTGLRLCMARCFLYSTLVSEKVKAPGCEAAAPFGLEKFTSVYRYVTVGAFSSCSACSLLSTSIFCSLRSSRWNAYSRSRKPTTETAIHNAPMAMWRRIGRTENRGLFITRS